MVATLYVHAILFLFQTGNPGASGWDLRSMWSQVRALARTVVVILLGLFGTVVGILNACKGIEQSKATGLSAGACGIAEALVTTALALLVADPAVWAYNHLTNKVKAFPVDMNNPSTEPINHFNLHPG